MHPRELSPWDPEQHERKIGLLGESPLFRRLAYPDLSHLAFACELIAPARGTALTRAGEPGTHFYLVEAGEISIAWTRGSSRVELRRDRSLVGWSALVEPFTYSANAIAGDGCVALRLNTHEVLSILQQRPDVGFDVMAAVASIARSRFALAMERLSAFTDELPPEADAA